MDFSDHLIVLAFAVLYPAYGAWAYPGLLRRIDAGQVDARLRTYVRVVTVQWTMMSAIVWWWISRGRPVSSLGLTVRLDRDLAIAAAMVAAAVGLSIAQIRRFARDQELRADIRKQLERVPRLRGIFPRTPTEFRLFLAVSVTAGVCEEVLFRGYLLAYLESFGLTSILAGTAAALWFGVAHAYQGLSGMLKTAAVGLVLMGLYLWTGSLWVSIALHTLIDVRAGVVGWLAFKDDGGSQGHGRGEDAQARQQDQQLDDPPGRG